MKRILVALIILLLASVGATAESEPAPIRDAVDCTRANPAIPGQVVRYEDRSGNIALMSITGIIRGDAAIDALNAATKSKYGSDCFDKPGTKNGLPDGMEYAIATLSVDVECPGDAKPFDFAWTNWTAVANNGIVYDHPSNWYSNEKTDLDMYTGEGGELWAAIPIPVDADVMFLFKETAWFAYE